MQELTEHGMNGVICFQETYHKAHYNIYHPRGMKSKFEWRVNGFDRMGQAGVHSIGMGVLIGLEKEWRTDVTMMAYHLRYLQKHYWQTKYSVNFPRMRPSENGGFQPNVIMSDQRTGTSHFCHAYLRPRCGHLLLHPRACRYTRPYGNTRCDNHECRKQDRAGRILQLSANAGTVSCQRRAQGCGSGQSVETPGARTGVERLGCEF